MDRDEALFVNLVMIFKSAAMQQMGKVVNPLTGKVERNLEQARFSIDTIAMLKDKTAGNISADLAKLLDSVLLELRMNFVEETRVGDTTPAAGEAAGAAETQAPEGQEGGGPGAGEAPAEGAEAAVPGEGTEGREEGTQDCGGAAAGGEERDPDRGPEDSGNGRKAN